MVVRDKVCKFINNDLLISISHPQSIDSDFEIERLGELIISNDKKAHLVSPTKPKTNFISIADTKQALGFTFPIFMIVDLEEKKVKTSF